MKKVFLLILLFITSFANAEVDYIDSLKKALKTAKHDTLRLFILSELSDNAPDGEWPQYNEEMLKLSEEKLNSNPPKELITTYKQFLANGLHNKAILTNEDHGDPLKALQLFERSLAIRKELGEKAAIAQSLSNIGYVYKDLGDIPKALEYYNNSLRLHEEAGYKPGMAQTLTYIGIVYKELEDYKKTLEYWERGLKIREEIGNKRGISESLNNLGVALSKLGDKAKALEYYQRSLAIKNELGDYRGIASNYINIGFLDKETNPERFLEYLNKALKIYEELGYKHGVANTLLSIGDFYHLKGDNINGLIYAKKALVIGQDLGFPSIIHSAAEDLYKIYKEQGNVSEALKSYELFVAMKDSLDNENTRKASFTREIQYQYQKKAAADSVRVQEEKKVVAEQLKREEIQRYGLYSGLALVIVFAGFMSNRFKVTQKQKKVIEDQKLQVESQKSLVEVKQKEIIDSINYAKRIQSAILAKEEDIKTHFPDSFLYYLPKDIVAGDFYFFETTSTHVFYAAADCTGHGVPGALVSVICANALTRCIKEFKISDPGQILDKAREMVLETLKKSGEELKDGMDISLVVKDLNTGNYSWAGANNPLWIIREGELKEIKGNKQPIGFVEDPKPFATHVLELKKGDLLLLFTDGYADQFGGPAGKKFKYKQLQEIIVANASLPQNELHSVLNNTFENWRGNHEQVDDVCLIGVRV